MRWCILQKLDLDLIFSRIELDFIDLAVSQLGDQLLAGFCRPSLDFGIENFTPFVAPAHRSSVARRPVPSRDGHGAVYYKRITAPCHRRHLAQLEIR